MRGLTSDEEVLHREIIKTRDEYVAHAGSTKEEQATTLLFLSPDQSEKKVIAIYTLSLSVTQIPQTKLIGMITLINKIIRNVTEARCKVLEAVKKEIDNTHIDDLYEKSIIPKADNLIGEAVKINGSELES